MKKTIGIFIVTIMLGCVVSVGQISNPKARAPKTNNTPPKTEQTTKQKPVRTNNQKQNTKRSSKRTQSLQNSHKTSKPTEITQAKKEQNQTKTPKQSKVRKNHTTQTNKSVISDKRIDQLILELIDNMVYVQVEDFWYSSTQYKKNGGRGNDNSSEHVNNFYICKFEVTQELWSAVMGYNPSLFSNQGSSQNPVENVTWEECQEFIYELKDLVRGSVDFRMPTEEEWEYAAKGGMLSNGNKYSGSAAAQRVAWYEINSNGTTHHVGSLMPNELGLFDMSGNVSEWCETLYDRYYGEDNLDAARLYYAPNTRACRGGSWKDNNVNCGVKSRSEYDMDAEEPTIGLRLAASWIDPEN